jgi:A/G-specific adenine glycosylase
MTLPLGPRPDPPNDRCAILGDPGPPVGGVFRDKLLARELLRWYAVARRDLPWRRTQDPYRVWVSEVMLQQTRAEAVVPYYRTFLRAFPTLHSLARAREEDVLRVWAGLGYYARARNLHRAAKEVLRRGAFPATAAEWRRLPGVGRYTAAAVASIAFGEDAVAVDGNVLRVGLRLLGLRAATSDPRARQTVEVALGAALPRGRAGDFNQALMDLGATLCVPRSPRCEACPVQRFCRAHAEGTATSIPTPRRPPRKPHRTFVAVLVCDPSGRVLLLRQPPGGLWGSLWTLPYVEARSWREARPHLSRLVGADLRRGRRTLRFSHAFTHFTASFEVVAARCARLPHTGRFVRPDQPALALPAPTARLLRALATERAPAPAGRVSSGSTRTSGSSRSRSRRPTGPRSPGTPP